MSAGLDELRREILGEITVTAYADGGVQVKSDVMSDGAWCARILQHALDAVRGNHKRRQNLVIPARDVDLPPLLHAVKK